eukprot:TRINITY_DN19408_c0_g1_i3.p5 TRINITY_DN19408_c0_g1~~TRINITY_DN19408_c0_g1_i3.p5  ORF type:complete len:115 (-),score=11.18 TRINITY_DN19408_c0_g1_i3:1452-1796(-)
MGRVLFYCSFFVVDFQQVDLGQFDLVQSWLNFIVQCDLQLRQDRHNINEKKKKKKKKKKKRQKKEKKEKFQLATPSLIASPISIIDLKSKKSFQLFNQPKFASLQINRKRNNFK